MLNFNLPSSTPFIGDLDNDLSNIPLKKSLEKAFFNHRESRVKLPSPTSQRIADVDLQQLLSNENLDINDIEPLAALTIFDFVLNHLIRRANLVPQTSESREMARFDNDGNCDNIVDSTTSLSPRKKNSSISSARGAVDYEEESDELKSQKIALSKRFLLKAEPDLSSTQFLERINRYCQLSTAVYLSSCFYIYRIVVEMQYLQLTKFNIHRLIIAALRISCKTIEDINHRQQFISKICGVKLEDLGYLEISFLFLIKFECQVDSEILSTLITNVKKIHNS